MKNKPNSLTDELSAEARERYEQAMVDADIEGLASDQEAARLAARMDAERIPIEAQIERLKAYFVEKERLTHAAE